MSFGGGNTAAPQAATPEQASFKSAVAGYAGRTQANAGAVAASTAPTSESILMQEDSPLNPDSKKNKLGVA